MPIGREFLNTGQEYALFCLMQAYPFSATVIDAVGTGMAVLYLGKSVHILAGGTPVHEVGRSEAAALTEQIKAKAKIFKNILV